MEEDRDRKRRAVEEPKEAAGTPGVAGRAREDGKSKRPPEQNLRGKVTGGSEDSGEEDPGITVRRLLLEENIKQARQETLEQELAVVPRSGESNWRIRRSPEAEERRNKACWILRKVNTALFESEEIQRSFEAEGGDGYIGEYLPKGSTKFFKKEHDKKYIQRLLGSLRIESPGFEAINTIWDRLLAEGRISAGRQFLGISGCEREAPVSIDHSLVREVYRSYLDWAARTQAEVNLALARSRRWAWQTVKDYCTPRDKRIFNEVADQYSRDIKLIFGGSHGSPRQMAKGYTVRFFEIGVIGGNVGLPQWEQVNHIEERDAWLFSDLGAELEGQGGYWSVRLESPEWLNKGRYHSIKRENEFRREWIEADTVWEEEEERGPNPVVSST